MNKEKWEKQFDERWNSYIAKSDKQKHFIKDFIKWLLLQERERIAEELVKIEKRKWKDAEHCSCLGYAIVTVFGEEYEDKLNQ